MPSYYKVIPSYNYSKLVDTKVLKLIDAKVRTSYTKL